MRSSSTPRRFAHCSLLAVAIVLTFGWAAPSRAVSAAAPRCEPPCLSAILGLVGPGSWLCATVLAAGQGLAVGGSELLDLEVAPPGEEPDALEIEWDISGNPDPPPPPTIPV